MSGDRRVTICVPVFNGRGFVAETLDAIQCQRYPHLTVIVSDDGSDDGSADVCRSFAADARFRLIRQPVRLGWVDHCNWLLRHAPDDLICIVSHDDLLEPDHVARLVERVSELPECAMAFSDIRVFGLLEHVEQQPSIVGEPDERALAFIASHYDGTAFHGLIQRSALEKAGGLRGNAMDHFAADVAWLARLARAGALLRVPEPLYRKRRHDASASMQWGRWSDARKAEAWTVHCRELLSDARGAALSGEARRAITHATVRRLLAIEPPLPFAFIRAWSREQQARMVEMLLNGECDRDEAPTAD